MDVTANVTVPTTDTAVLHEPGLRRGRHPRLDRSAPAGRPATARPRRTSPTTAATGPTPCSCATSPAGDSDCTGTVREQRFQYAINAGTAVTAPPGRLLTRAPELVHHEHPPDPRRAEPRRVDLRGPLRPRRRPRAPTARSPAPRPRRSWTAPPGSRTSASTSPGRWLIVARAKAGDFFTPWSAPVNVTAIAPFDLERTSFPDSRGPSYKVRGQVRERARPRQGHVSIARGKKKGKFRRIGKAKINSKGRFTKRFKVRKTGRYRLRYTLQGLQPRAPAAASPSRCASAAACSSASGQLCGPAGVASGAGSTTLRHCTIWRRRIRNAVLASPPTPAPQRPGPGRSVRRNLATTYAPVSSTPQDLRAARQRAVEEAHVVAAGELDRRGAVGDDARDREVAHRALDAGRGAARPPSRG